MNFLRKIYLQLKNIPLIGKVFVFMRNLLFHPVIQKRRLQIKDFTEVKKVAIDLFDDPQLVNELLRYLRSLSVFNRKFSHGHSGNFDAGVLYILTRYLKPQVIVETGVASGRSSAVILQALHDNASGELHSVDLPHFYEGREPGFYTSAEGNKVLTGYVPKGTEPGWLVPENLRDRWKLHLGDSKQLLPQVVNKVKSIDIFYHDSDHSYEYMMFEFTTTWDAIKPGGFLLADDITWNSAFDDFVDGIEYTYIHRYRNFGIVRKK